MTNIPQSRNQREGCYAGHSIKECNGKHVRDHWPRRAGQRHVWSNVANAVESERGYRRFLQQQ